MADLVKSEEEMNAATLRIMAGEDRSSKGTEKSPKAKIPYDTVYADDMERPLGCLSPLSVRAQNCLKSAGIRLGDLVRLYNEEGTAGIDRELLRLPNFGRTSLHEVKVAFFECMKISRDSFPHNYVHWCIRHRDIIEPIMKLAGDR